MGRGIRHARRKHKNKKEKARQQIDPNIKGEGYKDIARESELFQNFYSAQKNLCPEDEFGEMLEALRKDLPASFRVTGFKSQAIALRNLIESQYLNQLTELADQNEKLLDSEVPVIRPSCLEWYPDKMGWQLNLTRKDIRRQEIYFKLHNFLISETDSGNISRQETVSMIPPLVLDVQPHHKVLDMCAAPGSKTAQLIEALHSQEGTIPEGVVIANDADNMRCYMLVHQAKRLQSPCMIVTNHDASNMPNIMTTDTPSGNLVPMKFDRILCDVPCTGDGTLRKNVDIWQKWNAANAANLHGVQYRIAKRGLEMLAVGGKMVYSTCSLNPMEDEAVVARILSEAGGSVELVEVSKLLPGLKFKMGVDKWIVANKDGDLYNSWNEVPEKFQSQLRPSMFPPEDTEGLHLDRCIRILPHLQDTGGFFVAVLEKKSLCSWEHVPTPKPPIDKEVTKPVEPARKRPRFQGYREDPFIYFEDNDKAFCEVQDYFKLKNLESKMFLTRCKDTEKKNNLYFTSLLVRDILKSNLDRIKIINTGVKAFSKCENKGADCTFRLAQEGASMVLPFLGSRIVTASRKDLEIMLSINDIDNPPAVTLFEEETQKQFNNLPTGSVAIFIDDEELKFGIVGWKGKATVRAYVPRNERLHYLRLIGADTSKFETNKFQQQRDAEKKTEENGNSTDSPAIEGSNPEVDNVDKPED